MNKLWLKQAPNIDRYYKIAMDLYLAREMGNLILENELKEYLIFITRSKEISIKITRLEEDPYNPIFVNPGRIKSE